MANVPKYCAACTYKRRRCTENCPLALYFPMEKMDDFIKVHKLYGTNRLVKIIESIPINERFIMVENVINEARQMELNPQHGLVREANQITETKNLTEKLINDVRRDTEFIKTVIEIEKEIDDLDKILDSNPLEFVSSSPPSSIDENEKVGSSSPAETSHVAK